MPDLADIATFVEVVDSGSLGRAALRLGLSKSMVSRRLSWLEVELGMLLLARSTRGLSRTEAGADFRPHAERPVAEMQAARDALSRTGEATGRLRLSAPVSFGHTHQAAVLAELALRHPRLEIATPPISPEPEELARHETIPHGDATWRFQRRGRTVTFRPRGRFADESGTAELVSVVAGLGISLMPGFLTGPALARGDVAQIFPDGRCRWSGSMSFARRCHVNELICSGDRGC